jgi:Uma2 family endonuclease
VPEHLVAEIIDGVLETHPRPRPRHQRAAGRLNTRLSTRYEDGEGGPGGWIFLIEPELHLGSDVLVPDVAGWKADRLSSEPSEPFIKTPPDWVCEVLSPSTARLDRGAKRRIYAEAGVGHLWLLDPVAGELEAFDLAGRKWLLAATIQRGETVAAPPFEAAPFPLNDLFPFDKPSSTEA